jgi:hypothetical protein
VSGKRTSRPAFSPGPGISRYTWRKPFSIDGHPL